MPELAEPGSYLICATPRTGSTLLCGLLGATGIAGNPESYFRLQGEPEYAEKWGLQMGSGGPLDYRRYARAARAAGGTPNGVFSARVMWDTMGELLEKLRSSDPSLLGTDVDVLEKVFGRLRFVHLRRNDSVAQAVSWALAERTGYWHDYGGTVPPGRHPHFDLEELDGYVRTINGHNAAWLGWFGSHAIMPLVVTYEELVADMGGTTARILRFLGLDLPLGYLVAPETNRLSDEVNEEWARRYRTARSAEL